MCTCAGYCLTQSAATVSELIKADPDDATQSLRQCVDEIAALYRESDDMLADLDIDIQPTTCTACGWLCNEDIRIEMKIQLSRCLPLRKKRKLE
jgi:predicted Zn-ribbon and HTH transcriptional regulator